MQTTFKTKGIFIEKFEKKLNRNKCRVKKIPIAIMPTYVLFFIKYYGQNENQNKTRLVHFHVSYPITL